MQFHPIAMQCEAAPAHQFQTPVGNHCGPSTPCMVVSDVILYRDGVAAGLARLGRFQSLVSCGLGDAVANACLIAASVVFLDISRNAALGVARQLNSLNPMRPIIGFGIGDHDEAIACAEAGISAFVGAEGTIDDLDHAARLALEGQLICSPILAAKLVHRLAALSEAHAATPIGLTRRETEIAGLVDSGLSNKEIGQALRISPATVKNHVHMILEKLHIHRRAGIGRLLANHGAPAASVLPRSGLER